MPNKKKEIELIPAKNVASGWKVKHDGKEGDKPGSGPDSYPLVQLPPKGGPHLLIFRLPPDKPNEEPILFDPKEPMQVHPGPDSPTLPGMDPEIEDWAIFDGGKTLVLLDLNSKDVELAYRVKADGYDAVLDPIIKNGGGPYPPPLGGTPSTAEGAYSSPPGYLPPYSGAEIGVAAVALALAFLVGFFGHKWFGGPASR